MKPDFNYRFNELLAYLKDKLTAKQRHDIELEANRDPFLQEALEGFSQLTPEELENDVALLQSKLPKEKNKIKPLNRYLRITASIVLFLSLGSVTWYLINNGLKKQELAYQTLEKEKLTNDKATLAEPVKPVESAESIAKEEEIVSPQKKLKENTPEVREKTFPKPIKKKVVEALIVLEDDAEMDVAEESIDRVPMPIPEKDLNETLAINTSSNEISKAEPNAALKATEQRPMAATEPNKSVEIVQTPDSQNKKIVIRGMAAIRTQKLITQLGYKNTYDFNAKPDITNEAWEKYLEEAFDAKNSSKFFIFLTLIVDESGTIKEVICPMKHDDFSCAELEQLITSGPKWLNATNNGKPTIDTVSLYIDYYRQP
ncbi:MAG: hypothetical protein AB7E36_11640 [Salinivirgaceae bacterium]